MKKKVTWISLLGIFIWVLSVGIGCDALTPITSSFTPDDVSNVKATVDSNNQVVLTWTRNDENADGYKIARSYDGNHFFEVGTAKKGATTYTDVPPAGWSVVGYAVGAYNKSGTAQGAGSNWAFANPPSGWSTTTLSTSPQLTPGRANIALAVDSSNNLHAVYLDRNNTQTDAILYRNKSGSAWGPAVQVGKASPTARVAIAVDQKGNPHIIYDNIYTYSSDEGITWPTTATSLPANPVYSAIVIDSNNKAHAVYLAGLSIKYATNASGAWTDATIETLPNNSVPGLNPSGIAIDSINKIHVVYSYYPGGSSKSYVKYATNSTGTWANEAVMDITSKDYAGPRYVSLALDSNNKPHVVFNNASLFYANKDGNSWSNPTEIDNIWNGQGFMGIFSSIAIDKSNKVHIAYREYCGPSLKYATNASGSWVKSSLMSSSVKVPNSIYGGGGTCPMKIDNKGKIHIVFVDLATSTGSGWAYKYITN